jgi:hypothetical protein
MCRVDQVVDHLVAHVATISDRSGASMISRRWREDHLALVVHHVVELEQLLADVEVAPSTLACAARATCSPTGG